MHESGCFVLPNPWDIGTAIYLEHLGFEALATTSAGFAFSRGKRDGGVPRDEMLGHIREIVEATNLPVNADFLAGYADEPAREALPPGEVTRSALDSTRAAQPLGWSPQVSLDEGLARTLESFRAQAR